MPQVTESRELFSHELEDVMFAEQPKATKCPGSEGLKAEHDEFVAQEEPAPEKLDQKKEMLREAGKQSATA